MGSNGFSNTLIIEYEHDWDGADAYPIVLLQNASDAFTGASFHCCEGSVSD